MENQERVIERLVRWGEQQALVRAMLLTSSRAIPQGPVDILSDYDVILALTDILPFHESRAWLEAFGRVLAWYQDPLEPYYGILKSGNVIQFEDGLKIDFTLWPVEILRGVVADPQLPAELDAGYLVLLDKDGLADGLQPPTYKAYIPTPPTEAQYTDLVASFFLGAGYVAKCLWRDDLMAAKHILDDELKQEHLRPVLEWRMEIDHHWSVKPGPYGRRLKRWTKPDIWAALESTYTGTDPQANWEALLSTIVLFRRVAIEVGERLGYAYPHDLDRRAVAYLRKVRGLDGAAHALNG
jgi:aminoglycoside 6-adenylyltransferase